MIYIGKCSTKGCGEATRVRFEDVQHLDSGRFAKNAAGEKVLLDELSLKAYDRERAFILNGVAVSARCAEHGVYRLRPLNGRTVEAIKCDARCTGATGPKCDCSCGGANHGADHGGGI